MGRISKLTMAMIMALFMNEKLSLALTRALVMMKRISLALMRALSPKGRTGGMSKAFRVRLATLSLNPMALIRTLSPKGSVVIWGQIFIGDEETVLTMLV